MSLEVYRPETCVTVLKPSNLFKEIKLSLLSDDFISSEDVLIEDLPLKGPYPPVKLDRSKFFMLRKPEDIREEASSSPPTDLNEAQQSTLDNNPPKLLRNASKKRTKRKGAFACKLCSRSFVFDKTLEKHVSTHHQTKVFCEICDKCYSNKNALIKHVKQMHCPVQLHVCDKCNKVFRSKNGLRDHHLSIHLKFTIRCDGCGQKYTCKGSYREHLKSNPSHAVPKSLKT